MAINPQHLNKLCLDCGWETRSFISRRYKYCPMCASELEEFDMRSISFVGV